jgi:hypothetical protein
MGSITIMCPASGQRVETGIEMSRSEFDAMPLVRMTMHCWVCGREHSWSKRWATFVEDSTPRPGIRAQARTAEPPSRLRVGSFRR